MRTFYFYSLPNSKEPSPYFFRVPSMLRDLSRKGILRFRLWQGRHEAPVPLGDGPEPVEAWCKDHIERIRAGDDTAYKTRVLGEFPAEKSECAKYPCDVRHLCKLYPGCGVDTKHVGCRFHCGESATPILPAAPWPIRTEIGAQP